ncbi:MAG: precorrin-3B synthase [Gordonia sp. (in: high G+C Gram-positive bacteria)]
MTIPGDFAIAPSEDGHRARIRLLHGLIEAANLDAIAVAADDHEISHLELVAHGVLWLHGIKPESVRALTERLHDAGLVASDSPDRTHTIEVSSLSGRIGGLADVWAAAAELGHRARQRAGSGDLPAEITFGFDDGHGDVLMRQIDIVTVAVSSEEAELVVAGQATGRIVPVAEAPAAMITVAEAFALGGAAGMVERAKTLGRADLADHTERVARTQPTVLPTIGWFTQADGRVLLGAVTESGRLSPRQAQFAAAIGVPVLFTHDREIVIADLTEGVAETVVRVLAPMGFIFDADAASKQ